MYDVLRSPLAIFTVAGFGLFVIARLFAPPAEEASGRAIVVEREALLAYVQRRSGEADATKLVEVWDGLDAEARQVWVDRFVREEALVREARRLELDRDDDLIRRRLVQQMEFLVAAEIDSSIDEAALQAAYPEYAAAHRIPAIATFAHVFVRDAEALTRGPEGPAHARARALRDALVEEGVGFEGAGRYGDRFLYHRAYVDRTLDEVRAHFGAAMAASLETLSADPARWQGPIASQHGWHAVLLRDCTLGRAPTLEEVRTALAEDILRTRREASIDRGVADIVAGYPAEVSEAVLGSSGEGEGAARSR